MRFSKVLCIVLLHIPLHASRLISLNVGPTIQYTRYTQGCLPKQSGPMSGVAFDTRIKKAWKPAAYIGFRGLWDIPHICSENGLIIDSNEYQVNGHLGFNFESDDGRCSIIPFTGIDFIHLSHQIKCDIIRHKYFQINVPIGVGFLYNPSECFSWGIKTYYDIDAWTRLKVATPCLTDTQCCKIKLKRGHRAHVEMPLKWHYRVDERVGIDISWIPLFTWQKFNSEKLCCPESCTPNPCCITGTSDPDALNIPVLKQWHLGSILTFGITF